MASEATLRNCVPLRVGLAVKVGGSHGQEQHQFAPYAAFLVVVVEHAGENPWQQVWRAPTKYLNEYVRIEF